MHRRAFLAVAGAAALAGCSGGDGVGGSLTRTAVSTDAATPTPAPTATRSSTATPTRPRPLKGVSLSPQSYGTEDFSRFLGRAAEAGGALRWAGDWAELGDPEGAPAVVATVARQHGLAPVIDAGVFSADSRELFRPLTAEVRSDYVESAAAFAAEHSPAYLGLGVEVNLHHESDTDSFEAYVDLFDEAATAVADVAPETTVTATFQYEQLQGLRGGLFGGENDPSTAEWDLLDRFPAADVLGLTTYPGLIYRDPADIPDGYFDPVADRTDRPLAVTETGWSALTVAEGWASDPAEQAAYVDRLFELVDVIDPLLLIWLWVYDQSTAVASFEGLGLRRADGTARPAWDAWLAGGG